MANLSTLAAWSDHLKYIATCGDPAIRTEVRAFVEWTFSEYHMQSPDLVFEKIYGAVPVSLHGSVLFLIRMQEHKNVHGGWFS